MKKCYDCTHVEMCGWRKEVKEQGCEFFDDGMVWIPVSERLPKEDTDVLISYRYKEGEGDTKHSYLDITSYGDMYFGGNKVGREKHWRQPFEYFASNYEVIAWMPLPKPYREDGEACTSITR